MGGGSMGSRRMRDLHGRTVRGESIEVRLWDARPDRRDAALARFGVGSFNQLDDAMAWEPDAVVVSTPPDQHADLVLAAVQAGSHVFSEADIWPARAAVADRAAAAGVLAAPSATLLFQPVVREVRRIVATELGTVHAFGYVLSVDGRNWHPGEGSEYYARHRQTAPAREMTAFELIALQHLVGQAVTVDGIVTRRGGMAHEGEDTYCLQYRTGTGAAGQLAVLMATPHVLRRGWIAGDAGVVGFDLAAGTVRRDFPGLLSDQRMIAHWGDTLESTYLDEITTFIDAIEGTATWPYTLHDSALVCSTLAAAELSSLTGRTQPVRPDLVPATVPDAYSLPD
jgi:predicted dehydrogenase